MPDASPVPSVSPTPGASPAQHRTRHGRDGAPTGPDEDDALAELLLGEGIDPGPALAPGERPGVRARLRSMLGLDPEAGPERDPEAVLAELERRARAGEPISGRALADARAEVEVSRLREPARLSAEAAARLAAAERAAEVVASLFEAEALQALRDAYATALEAVEGASLAAVEWQGWVTAAAGDLRACGDVAGCSEADEARALVLSARIGRATSPEAVLVALGDDLRAQRAPLTGQPSTMWRLARPPLPVRPTRPVTAPPRRVKPIRTTFGGSEF